MKIILSRMMEEFRTWVLPSLTDRQIYIPEVPGKVTVITGMRRTGKTFVSYQKMHQLLQRGISRDRILYLNFDDDRLLRFKQEDFQTVLDVYFGEFPDNRDQLCYFFFDEIQRVSGWENFIRRLIDREKVQITLTGSSSTLLSKEIASTMRGRSVRSVIYPYSFEEFLLHHKVLQKAFRVLELASRRRNILAGDLAEELGLPRSTCVRLLKDLTESGYLVQGSRGRGYSLGPLPYFLVDGTEYLRELTGRGREILKDLAHSQRISVLLAVRHGSYRVVLAGFNEDSSLQVDFSNPRCYDCHLSVSGRLLLACAPEEERSALVKEFGVLSKGPFAGLTAAEILDRLASCRESGELIERYKDRMAAALPVFRNKQVAAVLGAVWRSAGNEERLARITTALHQASAQLSSCLSSVTG